MGKKKKKKKKKFFFMDQSISMYSVNMHHVRVYICRDLFFPPPAWPNYVLFSEVYAGGISTPISTYWPLYMIGLVGIKRFIMFFSCVKLYGPVKSAQRWRENPAKPTKIEQNHDNSCFLPVFRDFPLFSSVLLGFVPIYRPTIRVYAVQHTKKHNKTLYSY